MYVVVGKNQVYVKKGRIVVNDYVDQVVCIFNKDEEFMCYFYEEFVDGKWN